MVPTFFVGGANLVWIGEKLNLISQTITEITVVLSTTLKYYSTLI